jgi:hypothetical protein
MEASDVKELRALREENHRSRSSFYKGKGEHLGRSLLDDSSKGRRHVQDFEESPFREGFAIFYLGPKAGFV